MSAPRTIRVRCLIETLIGGFLRQPGEIVCVDEDAAADLADQGIAEYPLAEAFGEGRQPFAGTLQLHRPRGVVSR